jgi:2-polyprenyl-3-methyl-5-hydroxy-6-metoxy-1,4-benzoquinol methylase
MSHDEELERSWELNATAWTEAVRGGAIESRRLATDRAVLDLVLSLSPGLVLDVGCGEGWLCRALSARSIRAVGIDGSEQLIQAARELGGAEYHLLDYHALVLPPAFPPAAAFDVIVLNFALLQDDHQALLTSLRERLAPGGAIVIQTLHPWSTGREGSYQNGWRTETFISLGAGWEPMPWYFRTLSSWAAELRASGYLISDIREPTQPGASVPASLLIVARPER